MESNFATTCGRKDGCCRECIGFGFANGLMRGEDHCPRDGDDTVFNVDMKFSGVRCKCVGGAFCTNGSAFSLCCKGTTNSIDGYCAACHLAAVHPAVKSRVRYALNRDEINHSRSAKRRSFAAANNKTFYAKPRLTEEGSVINRRNALIALEKLASSGTVSREEIQKQIRIWIAALLHSVAGGGYPIGINSNEIHLIAGVASNLLRHKNGRRFGDPLRNIAVHILNISPAALRGLKLVFPSLLPSVDTAKKLRKVGAIAPSEGCGIYTSISAAVLEKYISLGWCATLADNRIKCGPLQFSLDSTAVRELVTVVPGKKLLMGFTFLKDHESNYSFSTAFENDINDISAAFEEQQKAGYALVGMYSALYPDLPHIICMLIGHNNEFSSHDLRHWVEELQYSWLLPLPTGSAVAPNLPVVFFASDLDAKQLQFVEELGDEPSIEQRASPLFADGLMYHFPTMGKHMRQIVFSPDPRHVNNLFWHNMLKMDKVMKTPSGVVHIAHLLPFLDELGQRNDAHVVSNHFHSEYKQDKGLGLDVCSAGVRRGLLEFALSRKIASTDGTNAELCSSNMATIVYLFMQDTLVQVTQFDSSLLPIALRVKLAGCVRYLLLFWRAWTVAARESHATSLKYNFLSRPLQKGIMHLCEGILHRVRMHRDLFPEFPISFDNIGTQCCEDCFQMTRAAAGGAASMENLFRTCKHEVSAGTFPWTLGVSMPAAVN